MEFNIKEYFQEKIDNLWDNAIDNNISGFENGYAVIESIEKHAVLFIGINPSFSKQDKSERFFYKNPQQGDSHKYFKKFQDLSFKLNYKKWGHIDLFFNRITSQEELRRLLNDRNAREFMVKQLDLSSKMIELSTPDVIVVCNSLGREWFKHRFDTEFDNKIGTHKITNNTLIVNTPVFFTSMLTGQRALDLGSYERLIWHIRCILEKS